MKKLIIFIVVCIVVCLAIFGGIKVFIQSFRPDLNGNEKIVSLSIDKNGKPLEKLGQITEVNITKDMGAVYLSIPVNNKNMKKSRVTLSLNGNLCEEEIILVSKAGYITYHFNNLVNRENGFYQLAFYDSQDKINLYAAIELK